MSTAIVSNCYSSGSIGLNAGGIFGSASIDSSITNSYSLGSIDENAGGIYGSLSSGLATNCYSTGTVGTNAGGIFGKDSTATITNCYYANGSWLDSNATSSNGTNHLDITTTPTYNLDNTISNSVGSTWLDQNIGLANVPYILSGFQIDLYSTNSCTLNYGQTGTSVSGSLNGKTYKLINNIGGITIDASTGELTFSNTVKAGYHQLKILYYDPSNSYGYLIGTYTLTINKIPLTVTPIYSVITITYGDDIPTLNYNSYTTSGLINDEIAETALTGTLSTTATKISPISSDNVTYPISIGTLTSENYNITLVPKNLIIQPKTLTVTPNAISINYGDNIPTTFAYTANGFVNGQDTSVITGNLNTSATDSSGIGNYTIRIGNLSAPNYTITLTDVKLIIQPATLTITPNLVTINYGDSIPALTYSASGFVKGQNTSIITGKLTTSATNTSVPGNYPITNDVTTPLTALNYTIVVASVNLVIQQKPITITAGPQRKKYTGTTQILDTSIFTVSGLLSGQSIQSVTLSSSGINVSDTPYAINISGEVAGNDTSLSNYSISYQTGLLTIEKAIPTIGNLVIPNKNMSDISFTITPPTKPIYHTGTWSYLSSDTNIATVNSSTGVVILVSSGIVKITATLSSDSNYLTKSITAQFLISSQGATTSTFSFVDSNTIVSNIPTDLIPVDNTVNITSLNEQIKQQMNPISGTNEEKSSNRSLVVKTLFDIYSTVTTITIPKDGIYLPPEIISNNITNVRLINTITSTSLSPSIIDNSSISQTDAFYCLMEINNAVVFNGTGDYSNYSIKIVKNSTNYSISKIENTNTDNSIGVKGDVIEYAGLRIILGSVTGQINIQTMKTGGDPIIQPLFGNKFALAPHIKYVNLIADFTSNTFVNAQVDMLNLCDFPEKIYWDCSFSETKTLSHIYANSYYRKFRINYQNEIIEIDADTLDVTEITKTNKLKNVKFTPKTGLKSISFDKTYPLFKTTKGIRVGFGNYLLTIISDISTDDRHHVELVNVKHMDLSNTCGALISKDQIIRINDLTGKEVYNFKSNPFYGNLNINNKKF